MWKTCGIDGKHRNLLLMVDSKCHFHADVTFWYKINCHIEMINKLRAGVKGNIIFAVGKNYGNSFNLNFYKIILNPINDTVPIIQSKSQPHICLRNVSSYNSL